ncbi:MAG: Flp pilus assembly protein CpaB [Candidatus Omnitrophota bacterium]|jgi:pilus assembly protein CpaB
MLPQIGKPKLMIIVGVILILMATFLAYNWLSEQRRMDEERAAIAYKKMQATQITVLVAKEDIPKGVVINPTSIGTKIVPQDYVQPQAVTSFDRISGMVTTADISQGEQISLTKLVPEKQAGGGALSGLTPAGKRAVTILVDNISSVAGLVKPGDYVDVMAALQVPVQVTGGKQEGQLGILPLFQNVLVLAVGQNSSTVSSGHGSRYQKKEDESGNTQESSNQLITLALAPQEAGLIAFVQEQGKIRLILRSPADAKVEQIQPATWETLFRYLMPQNQVQETVKQENPDDYVEVYHGLNKERVLKLK